RTGPTGVTVAIFTVGFVVFADAAGVPSAKTPRLMAATHTMPAQVLDRVIGSSSLVPKRNYGPNPRTDSVRRARSGDRRLPEETIEVLPCGTDGDAAALDRGEGDGVVGLEAADDPGRRVQAARREPVAQLGHLGPVAARLHVGEEVARDVVGVTRHGER